MDTIADRSFRVALTGVVPDDDPHIIADMMWRIEKLEEVAACLLDHYLGCYDGSRDALASETEKLVPNWATLKDQWKPASQ